MAPRLRAFPPPKGAPEEVLSPVASDDGSDVATILGEDAAGGSACKSSNEASGDGASSSEQKDSGDTDCIVCSKVLQKKSNCPVARSRRNMMFAAVWRMPLCGWCQ